MTIVQQASGTATGGGDFSIALPAASSAANRVIVTIVSDNVIATPAGWTLRDSKVNFVGHYLWDRAGGAAAYTFNLPGAGQILWWIAEVAAGVFVSSASAEDTSPGTSFATPSLTPTSGQRLIIASVGAQEYFTSFPSSITWSNSFAGPTFQSFAASPKTVQGTSTRELSVNGTTAFTTTATFDSNSASRSAIIAAYSTTAPPANTPPTANAGADQSVASGALVTLTGTESDSDGTIASRAWAQTGGPAVTLSGATTATATFTAPTGPATLTFSYTVTDNLGASSTPDSITITVAAPGNSAPTANAGADQVNVEPWSTVTLSGTSADTDGTIASRQWTRTAGPAVTLSGATTATATFEAPATIAGTTLTFSYAVTDDDGATGTDNVSVVVLPVTERAVIGGVEVPMRIRAT